MQGDLSMGVDRAHGELESELGKVDAVEGIRSQNWDPMCSRHAAELDKQQGGFRPSLTGEGVPEDVEEESTGDQAQK